MIADWMHPVLLEPTDTLFLRDSIPMSAGQGRGAGARLPLPSTLHEAVRASLFEQYGRTDGDNGGRTAFRPSGAPRTKGWLGTAKSVSSLGSKDFQSLQVAGPFPWLTGSGDRQGGVHFPLPMDVVLDEDGRAHTLGLLAMEAASHSSPLPALAVSPVPARKDQPTGFIPAALMASYLAGKLDGFCAPDAVLGQDKLFATEYHMGVAIDPASQSALDGQLYAATHARPVEGFRLAAWIGLKKPKGDEAGKLDRLHFLLLGGERRLARIHREKAVLEVPSSPAFPATDGPVILKWILATPAVFAHGWMPGWCRDSRVGRPPLPDHEVCLPLSSGRARLIATCQGKPQAFAGWDTLAHQAKPTQLATPAGSVFYFLCQNAATARDLAKELHWRPRSDVFGEKGFGYGFVAPFTGTLTPDLTTLAKRCFDSPASPLPTPHLTK